MESVFSLMFAAQETDAQTWEVEILGDRELVNKLCSGEAISFKLEDDTQVCLLFIEGNLFAEYVEGDNRRLMYYINDDDTVNRNQFIKSIYKHARSIDIDTLEGADVDEIYS